MARTERVEQLLDVAQELFGRKGFDGTSIEQIARSAGISRPIVYEHFGSKEGIYLACLRRARVQLDQAIAEGAAGVEDLEQRLRAGVEATFAFIESDPARWAVMFNGVALQGAVAEEANRLRFATVEAIADMIHAATPDVPRREAEACAHALSGAAEQIERWWRHNPDITREEIVGYLHRFAWQGLSHLIGPRPSRGAR